MDAGDGIPRSNQSPGQHPPTKSVDAARPSANNQNQYFQNGSNVSVWAG